MQSLWVYEKQRPILSKGIEKAFIEEVTSELEFVECILFQAEKKIQEILNKQKEVEKQ